MQVKTKIGNSSRPAIFASNSSGTRKWYKFIHTVHCYLVFFHLFYARFTASGDVQVPVRDDTDFVIKVVSSKLDEISLISI